MMNIVRPLYEIEFNLMLILSHLLTVKALLLHNHI